MYLSVDAFDSNKIYKNYYQCIRHIFNLKKLQNYAKAGSPITEPTFSLTGEIYNWLTNTIKHKEFKQAATSLHLDSLVQSAADFQLAGSEGKVRHSKLRWEKIAFRCKIISTTVSLPHMQHVACFPPCSCADDSDASRVLCRCFHHLPFILSKH